MIKRDMTIAEVLNKVLDSINIFSKYNIDTCCGADKRLKDTDHMEDILACLNKEYKITKGTMIGEALEIFPYASKIIERYFGQGCFSCPAIHSESLEFGAMMHGIDADAMVTEINKIRKEYFDKPA